MKPGPIVAAIVVILSLVFAGYAFKGSLVAYLPFKQAIAESKSGATVQVMGIPMRSATRYDAASGTLDFTLREQGTGALMPVTFRSPKPDSFDEATRITAIGRYDTAASVFEAQNLLVKCPSKYAGQSDTGANRQYQASQR